MKCITPNPYFLLFLGISICVACKKEDSGGDPIPPERNAIYETIAGKWEIISSSGKVRSFSSKIQDDAQLVSIEFLSDTTYVIIAEDYEVQTGRFTAVGSTTIDLANVGRLSEIKITGGSMNFKLFSNGIAITITANKAESIPLTGNTRLLCKNWYVTKDEDGAELYYDGIDKATVLFSAAGTYLVQTFNGNTVVRADAANWKWHPEKTNTFIYWWDDQEIDERENEVVIDELTDSKLRITETYYDYDYHYDDQQNELVDSVLVTEKFILIPVDQVSPRIANPVIGSNKSYRYSNRALKQGLFRKK